MSMINNNLPTNAFYKILSTVNQRDIAVQYKENNSGMKLRDV
ncbi:MAG TPA: hypothetical protein VFD00_06450 [Thermoclostridium sp.]|nr:hypothetical protein [Thermoclostridium sp.]